MHAYPIKMALCLTIPKFALIGRGNTARGALRILIGLGADVKVYDRRQEKLFRKKMPGF